MRRFIRIFLVAGLMASVAAPARAATFDIEVGGVTFTPAVVHAALGDQLRWNVTSGNHTITAYSGGTFAFPIVRPGETHTFNFEGGTALYRCEFHSSLDPLTLVCEGMCGSVTSRTTAPGAPSFTSPNEGASIATAVFRMEGTAEPQTKVSVIEAGNTVVEAVANAGGIWRADAFFANGPHTVVATATDVEGRAGPASPPRSFTITADTEPPTVAITSFDPTVGVYNPVTIAGRATDNLAVEFVEIEVDPPVGLTQTFRHTSCLGCFGPTATWRVENKIRTGVFSVRARSTDVSGNQSEWSEPITVISGDLRHLSQ